MSQSVLGAITDLKSHILMLSQGQLARRSDMQENWSLFHTPRGDSAIPFTRISDGISQCHADAHNPLVAQEFGHDRISPHRYSLACSSSTSVTSTGSSDVASTTTRSSCITAPMKTDLMMISRVRGASCGAAERWRKRAVQVMLCSTTYHDEALDLARRLARRVAHQRPRSAVDGLHWQKCASYVLFNYPPGALLVRALSALSKLALASPVTGGCIQQSRRILQPTA
jgi:hypothetical protein